MRLDLKELTLTGTALTTIPAVLPARRSAAGSALGAALTTTPELSATAIGPFLAAACKAIAQGIGGSASDGSASAGRSCLSDPADSSMTASEAKEVRRSHQTCACTWQPLCQKSRRVSHSRCHSLVTSGPQRTVWTDSAQRSRRAVLQAMAALGTEMADRFRLLGLLFVRVGEPLPSELLAALWGQKPADALVSAEALEASSLISRDIWTGGLCLHEVQQGAAWDALPAEDSAERRGLHAALLERAGEALRTPPSSTRWTRHWWGPRPPDPLT